MVQVSSSGGDVTDLSKYRNDAGSPPPAAGSSTGAYQPLAQSDDRQKLYHLTETEAALSVLFGSKNILDPGDGPTQTVHHRIGASGDDLFPNATVTSLAPVDSPWSMLDALQFFYTSTPDSRAYIQAAMYNQGLLPKNWNKFGQDDEASFRAWKGALLRSAKGGQTIWQTLTGKKVTMTQFFDAEAEGGNQVKMAAGSMRGGGGGGGGGGGSGRAPLTIRYSSPADLKAAARLAAQDTLGYVPDEDYLDDFVKLYHGMEGGMQRGAYAGKKSVTDPGNPQNAAAESARKENKTEAAGYDIVKAFSTMMDAMGVQNG